MGKKVVQFDFSGWATKFGVKCSDGRTILKDAFAHCDGKKVPLVWQHLHNNPENILGYAILENRPEGVYARGKFNDSEAGKNAKEAVRHGDIDMMSIYANELKQRGGDVLHGSIREVSLVLAGANSEARIENLSFAHGDGTENESEEDALIYTGLSLSHDSDEPDEGKEDEPEDLVHAAGDQTVEEIFNSFTDEQKAVVCAMLAHVAKSGDTVAQSDTDEEGDDIVKNNVFDKQGKDTLQHSRVSLTDAQRKTIFDDAKRCGSLKEAILAHADEFLAHADPVAGTDYGIKDIDILFPDAKTLTPTPDMISRNMQWVPGVLNGTRHTPFSRIKSTAADITADEARARGYVKGSMKKDEVIKLLKRSTGPTTVYKKQKLDRDDIVDIIDFNVVAWLKVEMRMMLDEELARAILIGDGRDAASPDKINEECIRPIWKDADLYAHHVAIEDDSTTLEIMDEIVRQRKEYKGQGSPNFYTTTEFLTDMLLLRDGFQRRLYTTRSDVAAALLMNDIIEVPIMSDQTRTVGEDEEEVTLTLLGIMVNLKDYSVGADRGGQVATFEDFDIDYNQEKYLIETRCSGALVSPKSALVFELKPATVPAGG